MLNFNLNLKFTNIRLGLLTNYYEYCNTNSK